MENSVDKVIQLEIFTPYGEYLKEEVPSIDILSCGTSFGLLPNHYPIISTLQVSVLYLTIENEKKIYAIGDGVIRFENNVATMLVECIERSDEIDLNRANEKVEEIKEKLKNENDKNLILALQKSLRKAENRIKVYNLGK